MIRKIIGIENFRVFQRWTPPNGGLDFERMNIVYGTNGSGKSTLATVLATAGAFGNHRTGVRLAVRDSDGASRTVTSQEDPFWQSVRVFNKEFVADNLRFDVEGASTGEPLLTLGKSRIDRDEKLASARDRRQQIQDQLPRSRGKAKKAESGANALLTNTATQIAQELVQGGPRYAARSYDARRVKEVLARPAGQTSQEDVAQCLELLNAPATSAMPSISQDDLNDQELRQTVQDLLSTTAKAEVIQGLRDDPQRARWVQEGLALHAVDDRCAFCEGQLTSSRLDRLARHFDQSLRQLQADIQTQLNNIEAEDEIARRVSEGLPSASTFDAELQEKAAREIVLVRNRVDDYSKELASLARSLNEKSSRLFEQISLGEEASPSNVSLQPLRDLIAEHNSLVSQQSQRKTDAAGVVERARVDAIREQHAILRDDAEDSQGQLRSLELEYAGLESQIAELSQQDLDAGPLADELNDDLARLLGRDELVFRLAPTGDGYQIERAGQPATYLSEGEKTAVSLLYFLKSLDTHGLDRADAVVVIDDPVSSLDANVVAGVSAQLWARLVGGNKCKQLFLLTHSFELFRSWSNSLDRLDPGVRNREDITYTTQELRVRSSLAHDGAIVRHPFFLPWPEDSRRKRRLRSEYHYLFWRVATTLRECNDSPGPETELDAAAVLPNVCRKMLEGFLGFKYPDKIGDFRGLMEAGIGDMDRGVTRTRLVTYLNAYSHNEEGDISRGIARPESINILSSVFELIRYVDEDHYLKMCAALDVEPLVFET